MEGGIRQEVYKEENCTRPYDSIHGEEKEIGIIELMLYQGCRFGNLFLFLIEGISRFWKSFFSF